MSDPREELEVFEAACERCEDHVTRQLAAALAQNEALRAEAPESGADQELLDELAARRRMDLYVGTLVSLHEGIRLTEDGEDVTVESLKRSARELSGLGQGQLSAWLYRLTDRWMKAEALRLGLEADR